MIEDDDSKIRRNLLVFSALVILAWWFDLQPSELVTKLLKLDAQLDPLKLCAAALAILAYLALRYKDAELLDSKTYREVVDGDLAVIAPTVAFHYAQFMAHLYTWTAFEASIFLGHLKTFIKQGSAGMNMGSEVLATRPKIWLRDIRNEVQQVNAPGGRGPWAVGATLSWDNSKFVNQVGTALAIDAAGIHRYFIWLYSRVWWFFFCEAAVRARFPVLFGFAAVAILCAKIFVLLAAK